MTISRRAVLQSSAFLATMSMSSRSFAAKPLVKIGVLADFSGIYNDLMGLGGVECVKQAVAEFTEKEKAFDVEVVHADHQHKADLGASIVRRWFDTEGVDMVIAGPNSSVALAASFVTKEKDKVCLGTSVTTADFTGKQCTPNSINWTYDGYMLSRPVAAEMVKSGGKKWYFVTTDNAFGNSLTADMITFIEQAGGKVVGNSRYPIGTVDFSSMLLSAQASGADVLGLSLGGSDLPTILKQAGEFGIASKMKMGALVVFLNDIHAVGVETMQNLQFVNSFYWDTNERTRAFTKRVVPRMGGVYPGMTHAGCYAVTLHYLKAVAALGAAEAKKSGAVTVAKMKELPTDDDAFGPASIRADGRALIPAYLLRVKTPKESKGPWDYCAVESVVAPIDAARPLNETGCPLIKT